MFDMPSAALFAENEFNWFTRLVSNFAALYTLLNVNFCYSIHPYLALVLLDTRRIFILKSQLQTGPRHKSGQTLYWSPIVSCAFCSCAEIVRFITCIKEALTATEHRPNSSSTY